MVHSVAGPPHTETGSTSARMSELCWPRCLCGVDAVSWRKRKRGVKTTSPTRTPRSVAIVVLLFILMASLGGLGMTYFGVSVGDLVPIEVGIIVRKSVGTTEVAPRTQPSDLLLKTLEF